ncbi:MAG: hypothetical protein R2752_07820 [Vicinamibacterales bacterium]
MDWAESRTGQRLGLLVLAVSLAANIQLVHNAREVKTSPHFMAGQVLGPLPVREPRGQALTMNVKEPTVLYVLAPGCTWCARDYENLSVLGAAIGSAYRVVGIVVRGSEDASTFEEYFRRHPFPGRLLILDLDAVEPIVALRFAGTPQLLVVDDHGTIQRAWAGALYGERQSEVEHFFGLVLPGIASSGVAPEEALLR